MILQVCGWMTVIHVFLETPDGRREVMPANLDWSGARACGKIAAHLGIPSSLLCLVLNGRQLDAALSLQDQAAGPDASFRVLLRLRGGGMLVDFSCPNQNQKAFSLTEFIFTQL